MDFSLKKSIMLFMILAIESISASVNAEIVIPYLVSANDYAPPYDLSNNNSRYATDWKKTYGKKTPPANRSQQAYNFQNFLTDSSETLAWGPDSHDYNLSAPLNIGNEYIADKNENEVYHNKIQSKDADSSSTLEDGAEIYVSAVGNTDSNTIILTGKDNNSLYIFEIGQDDTVRQILDNEYTVINPYFYNNLLVWSEDRNGTLDIFKLDLQHLKIKIRFR